MRHILRRTIKRVTTTTWTIRWRWESSETRPPAAHSPTPAADRESSAQALHVQLEKPVINTIVEMGEAEMGEVEMGEVEMGQIAIAREVKSKAETTAIVNQLNFRKGEFTMSTEQNKAIARQWREAMDQTQGAAAGQFLAADCIAHFPGSPPLDRDHVIGLIGVFYGAFPDLHHSFEDQVAEGDKVATHLTFRGTHNGDFQGIPATGKAVAFTGIVIDRFQDGKLAEHWSMFDMMGLMQQLGVIPTPGQ